jgi:hypothetical protein
MDTNLDLDALHQLTTSLGLLVASDTRTLEDDNKLGSYIYSASRALADAAGYLFEAIQLEQDAVQDGVDVEAVYWAARKAAATL